MAKYSKGAQKGVESAMNRMEKGKLRSGKSDKKVTNPKQAIAIGLSEAKAKGAKIPAKKGAVPKKAAGKKVAPKKAARKKPVLKKTAPKKSIAVKSVKVPVKKVAPKKRAVTKKVKEQPAETMTHLPKEIISKAANINHTTDEQPPVAEKSPALPGPKIEDPIMSVDKKVVARATSKMDPKHNMQLSSSPKNSLKPSGKKPLWRR
jgi:hypothetical protein